MVPEADDTVKSGVGGENWLWLIHLYSYRVLYSLPSIILYRIFNICIFFKMPEKSLIFLRFSTIDISQIFNQFKSF
jgi:hypothetical protein